MTENADVQALRRRLMPAILGTFAVSLILTLPVIAQNAPPALRQHEVQVGPKPDWSWLPQLRVFTETDYPPFNYYDEEGRLTGFNVDLAKAICRELAVPCEITGAEWKSLIPAVKNNEADAIIASVAINSKTLAEVDFTNRYYATPARFAARIGSPLNEISAANLKDVKVATVQGSAHEAFLRDFFGNAKIMAYPTQAEARAALKNGEADLLFSDAVSLMFWLQGTDSNRCCEFKGEGYFEPRYFGDGAGIAVRRGNNRLREVLDYALARVRASGRYEELMLRYFPLPLY